MNGKTSVFLPERLILCESSLEAVAFAKTEQHANNAHIQIHTTHLQNIKEKILSSHYSHGLIPGMQLPNSPEEEEEEK